MFSYRNPAVVLRKMLPCGQGLLDRGLLPDVMQETCSSDAVSWQLKFLHSDGLVCLRMPHEVNCSVGAPAQLVGG